MGAARAFKIAWMMLAREADISPDGPSVVGDGADNLQLDAAPRAPPPCKRGGQRRRTRLLSAREPSRSYLPRSVAALADDRHQAQRPGLQDHPLGPAGRAVARRQGT